MRGSVKYLAVALLAGVGCAAVAQSVQPVPRPSTRPAPEVATTIRAHPAVQALFDGYVADRKMPGIVAAVGVGDAFPTFVEAGAISADAGAAKAGPDSLWRVYSMTKPVTAMAAMMLIEDGKMSLDQPVSDFIPAFKSMKVLTSPDTSLDSVPAKNPITIRHLLTHTAGLGYAIITKGPLLKEYERLGITPAAVSTQLEAVSAPTRAPNLEQFANRLATLPLIAEPGTKWSYSVGLDLMGRVIEVASGMKFDEFLQKRMFDPLKMRSTYFTVPQSEVGRFATNYAWVGDNRVPLDPAATSAWLKPPTFPYGGAGLVSSARDYDRFLHMLVNGGILDNVRVLKPETVRLAMSNLLPAGVVFGGVAGATGGDSPAQGFGAGGSVYLRDVPGGASKGTYGWGGAAGTVAWVDPVRKIRGTIMVNYFPSDRYPVRTDVVKALYSDARR